MWYFYNMQYDIRNPLKMCIVYFGVKIVLFFNFMFQTMFKNTFYKRIVGSHFDYASSAWYPNLKKNHNC